MLKSGTQLAIVDQCVFGLCDPVSKLPFRKRTRCIGNLPKRDTLNTKCDKSHKHQYIEDSVWVGGRSMKRSALPPDLFAQLSYLVCACQRVCNDFRRMRVRSFLHYLGTCSLRPSNSLQYRRASEVVRHCAGPAHWPSLLHTGR